MQLAFTVLRSAAGAAEVGPAVALQSLELVEAPPPLAQEMPVAPPLALEMATTHPPGTADSKGFGTGDSSGSSRFGPGDGSGFPLSGTHAGNTSLWHLGRQPFLLWYWQQFLCSPPGTAAPPLPLGGGSIPPCARTSLQAAEEGV
ncbi:UNVERIFIED_CONTAM: hypothetical protein FKN15_061605 [Acipenser sinensis]